MDTEYEALGYCHQLTKIFLLSEGFSDADVIIEAMSKQGGTNDRGIIDNSELVLSIYEQSIAELPYVVPTENGTYSNAAY